MTARAAIAAVALLGAAGEAAAEPARSLAAARTERAPAIDGRLDEEPWADAPVAGAFQVRYPADGGDPAHPTDARVLYDDDALYVGIVAHDDQADAIRGVLTRRDVESEADWLMVGVDSVGDRRTSFVFAVNAAGVQRDYKIVDDRDVDEAWNAVWSSAVKVGDDGWTAELRIPLSQLRFSGDRDEWGLQITRVVARTGEESVWSPSPRTEQRTVSRYGRLVGLGALQVPRSLELRPYAAIGGDLIDATGMELRGDLAPRWSAGVDARYALGSGLVLTAAVNPDFGQVEADPSQVNLTDAELFFPERRPFFLEGAELFAAELGGLETLFYSRRIGAAPHGAPGPDAVEASAPAETTILAAAKLSGRTAGGWTIAALDAVGAAEHAEVLAADGTRSEAPLEPLANYGVARVRKSFRDETAAIGAVVTTTHRRLVDPAMSFLHDQAYTGAVEGEVAAADGAWRAVAMVAASHVAGSPEAIERTQRSSVRYFQRADAPHLALDPTRTGLDGAASHLAIEKLGGAWTGELRSQLFSPGFEPNDLGFLQLADAGFQSARVRRDVAGNGGRIAAYSMAASASLIHDFEPRLHAWTAGVDGAITFRNLWEVDAGVEAFVGRWDRSIPRGRLLLRVDPSYIASAGIATDPRRAVRAALTGYLSWTPANAARTAIVSPTVTIAPRPNLQIEVGARAAVHRDPQQFVDAPVDEDGVEHVVVGRVDQVSAAATVRVEYTWTPTLSLQLYARPYLTSGRFSRYREVTSPRAGDFADRFTPYAEDLADPSFDWRHLQSAVVLRWEYRPGSSLFVIWNHARESYGADGEFRIGEELDALAAERGEHVVLLKADYWLDL